MSECSGARMSWDGKTMWFVRAYRDNMFSVSMDGTGTREHEELFGANHDLAVLLEGGIATMLEATESTLRLRHLPHLALRSAANVE